MSTFLMILSYSIVISAGIFLNYMLISDIVLTIKESKMDKTDDNFVRVDLPEHAGFGPFHSIWNPPYRYIRKDSLHSELRKTKLYIKTLKKAIKGKKLSRDELMLLLEKRLFELESAVELPRHTCTAEPSLPKLELESLIRKCRTCNSDKVEFEDAQRSDNKEIVDFVRGEPRSGREVRLDNEAFDSDQGIKVVPGKRHCLIVYTDVDGLFRSKLIAFDFFTHDGLNVQFFCDGDLVDSCGYMKLESILFC